VNNLIIPIPDLQISFYHRLEEIRKTYLLAALRSTVKQLKIAKIDSQLKALVSNDGLQKIAGWGLRGEIIFATPYILEENPKLLGYYRLLLGFSQKQFYGSRYGFGRFKSMEDSGRLTKTNSADMEDFCKILCASAELLLAGIGKLSQVVVHDLTLLTLGPQLRGGALNVLGDKATQKIFKLINSLLSSGIVSETKRSMEVINASGRTIKIEFASDPDICIREQLPSGRFRNLVAIEMKGGRDYSNIHNRIGEAEKSHQKAKYQGYVECWTIVGVTGLDKDKARRESPTTNRFFHLDRIIDPKNEEAEDFRENLLTRVGVSL